jgi:hypothetical protein
VSTFLRIAPPRAGRGRLAQARGTHTATRKLSHHPRAPLARRGLLAALAGMLMLLTPGCGAGGETPAGLVISAPGLQTGKPPWAPEYKHLAERLRQLGLPPGGKETFHIHALLHIYVDGLLVPPPANIGLDPARSVESSMHTHDRTGIIHMEAPRPYSYTLGDFFAVWGVKFGPAQLGGLTGFGDDKLHFYLNGKPLRNPAAYVLRNHDSVVIGYGADSSFPHSPSTYLLKEVESNGGGALSCSSAPAGKHARSCLTTTTPAKPSTHNKR